MSGWKEFHAIEILVVVVVAMNIRNMLESTVGYSQKTWSEIHRIKCCLMRYLKINKQKLSYKETNF